MDGQRPDDERKSDRYNFLSNEFIVGIGLFVGGLIVAVGGWFIKSNETTAVGFTAATAGGVLALHSILADPAPKPKN